VLTLHFKPTLIRKERNAGKIDLGELPSCDQGHAIGGPIACRLVCGDLHLCHARPDFIGRWRPHESVLRPDGPTDRRWAAHYPARDNRHRATSLGNLHGVGACRNRWQQEDERQNEHVRVLGCATTAANVPLPGGARNCARGDCATAGEWTCGCGSGHFEGSGRLLPGRVWQQARNRPTQCPDVARERSDRVAPRLFRRHAGCLSR